ncbi:hypothetical protein pdam_00018658 [Pocillopora damicornis]|uniref:Uncharacterized protein n=1 Tax=Pocillopora damicornis TaxID=46731 RepID=A0A3M6U1P9_POCDA|nr:hypothetical protein pdam_00018658 [Pocillopora damicornis]
MRNALDRSYRDRHLIHRLYRAVTLESDLYSGVRQKPLISKNVLDKVYNLEKIREDARLPAESVIEEDCLNIDEDVHSSPAEADERK